MKEKIAYLTARYDELEKIAREAAAKGDGTQENGPIGPRWNVVTIDYEGIHVYGRPSGLDDEGGTTLLTRHMQAHDPAAVLLDLTAKRKIMGMAEEIESMATTIAGEWGGWGDVDGDILLEALLIPFCNRDDFEPDWAER